MSSRLMLDVPKSPIYLMSGLLAVRRHQIGTRKGILHLAEAVATSRDSGNGLGVQYRRCDN